MYDDVVTLAERALALDPQNVRAVYVPDDPLFIRVTDRWSDDPRRRHCARRESGRHGLGRSA